MAVFLIGGDCINNAGDLNKSVINLQTEESFYQKENKTLNVNVLAEESEEMQNNEISFDSEKFAKCEAKLRPRGTIENNLTGGGTNLTGMAAIKSNYRLFWEGFLVLGVDSFHRKECGYP